MHYSAKLILFITLIVMNILPVAAQEKTAYKKWNPATEQFKVLEGQAWTGSIEEPYDRLPSKAKGVVRQDVWNLSKNTAGLQLRFRSNASEIIVKFKVGGSIQMPHMPATGVSGVDLYSKTIDGRWVWAAGRFNFKDTVTYTFSGLQGNDQHVANREYTLYFPLYNSVSWMEISVPEKSELEPLRVRNDKPIVIYGTSIAQGGCATRPGLAWTNILDRKIDHPVLNLGFSGNGRLEPEVLDLVAEIDAKVYVLDCLPNLTNLSKDELKKKIIAAVQQLKSKRTTVPILLTAHDGYTGGEISPDKKASYSNANLALQEAYDTLIKIKTEGLYLLSYEAIHQDIESMVDGVHPNDIGMMNYAIAYEKILRTILNEPVGSIVTQIPITQRRDFNSYDWEKRHEEIIAFNKEKHPELLMIGNSITHYWAGNPIAKHIRGEDSWAEFIAPFNPVNMAYGWDRIENVLWRVYHGELEGISPKKIFINIGTNNLTLNTDEEIVAGLSFLLDAIRKRQPTATIYLSGIYPRRKMEGRVVVINKKIQQLAKAKQIRFINPGVVFLNDKKLLDESLFSDGLHPNNLGYKKLGALLKKNLAE